MAYNNSRSLVAAGGGSICWLDGSRLDLYEDVERSVEATQLLETIALTVNQIDDAASFRGDTAGAGNEDAPITGTLTVTDTADGMTNPDFAVTGAATNGTATIVAAVVDRRPAQLGKLRKAPRARHRLLPHHHHITSRHRGDAETERGPGMPSSD